MNAKKIFITLILLFIGCNVTMSQTYHIKSFDGKIVEVSLSYKMFSKKLAISCLTDTLHLLDYTGTQNVRVLNKRFIQIEYDVLGGIGVVNRNTLILSVNKNKIITSMLVNSHFEGFSPDKHILYNVKFKPKVNNDNNYQIQVYVSDEVKSKKIPSINEHLSPKIILSFDPNHKVFYSSFETLSKYFIIFKPDDIGNVTKELIKGKIPEMLLGKKYNYLYINNCWYSRGVKHTGLTPDSLVSYSYK
jgi:hypothetical protein